MDAQAWQKAQRLFLEVVERPEAERPAFLDEACAGDVELRSTVEGLLAADLDAPSILDLDGQSLADLLESESGAHVGPKTIGRYEIRGELGRGGMGAVYEAERVDGQLKRRVALKVIRAGFDSEQTLQRFQAEGRILARLEHSNIARLYDAGVDSGQPYLVMELVEGERIDLHCDHQRLDVPSRLRLFEDVCEAVQYAHQNLVIHRDLKPSNILVTPDGHVRLLDFGIAKLIEKEGDEHLTRTGFRAFTPEYSSPEQLQAQPVTTASDVYSLGVVLYELLTGVRPHTSGSGPLGMVQSILEKDPERPSSTATRAKRPGGEGVAHDNATPAAQPEIIAAARRTTPDRLARTMRGDLDTVVLKALQKEPTRRYTSVQSLLDDVRRYLEGRPVSARPDTLRYRAQKFVRRHRVGVGASAAAVIALVGGLAAAVWQAGVASEQRDVAELEAAKATRVTDFLIDVFQVSDPSEARADTLTAVQILRRGAERVETELASEPVIQATVMDVIGQVYGRLSLFDEADTLLTRGLLRRTELLGAEHPDVGQSLHNLAELARARSDPAADSLYRQALRVRRAVLSPGDPDLAHSLLGHAFVSIGADNVASEAALDEALDIFRGHPGDHETSIASAIYAKGFIRQDQGEYQEAEDFYRQALAVHLRRLGPTHPNTLTTQYNLGFLLQVTGRFASADSALQGVLDARREVYGDRHQRVSNSLYGLAELRHSQGDYRGAEEYIREAIDLRIDLLGAGSPQVTYTTLFLAQILQAQGDSEGAERIFDRLLSTVEEQSGVSGGAAFARYLNGYAGVLESKGDLPAAESYYRRAWDLYRDALGPTHPFTAIVQSNVGSVLLDQGELDRAEPLYREALASLREAYSDQHASVATTRMLIGTLEMQRGDLDAAEEDLRTALSVLEDVLPPDHWRLGQARMRMGSCLADLGRLDEAETLLLAAWEILEPQKGARRGDWRQLLTELFELYTALNRPDEAAEYQRLFVQTQGAR